MAAVVDKGEAAGVTSADALAVINGTVGDAKLRQMKEFTQEGDSSTPLTTYFGAKIAVRNSHSIEMWH